MPHLDQHCNFVLSRGCAHCGKAGSPSFGDGAFETQFCMMTFVYSSQRALFRHPNEAFLYDLDGILTSSNMSENYTFGGRIRGSSLVGTSCLLPKSCKPTTLASGGEGQSALVLYSEECGSLSAPQRSGKEGLCVFEILGLIYPAHAKTFSPIAIACRY